MSINDKPILLNFVLKFHNINVLYDEFVAMSLSHIKDYETTMKKIKNSFLEFSLLRYHPP